MADENNDELSQGGAQTPDQARNLAALAQSIADSEPVEPAASSTAENGDTVPGEGGEYIAGPNTASDEENLAGVLEMLFIPAPAFGFNRVGEIWTADVCRQVADRAVPVLRKSGIGRKILQWCRDGFGIEEMALAAVLFPIVKRTRDAFLADVIDIRAEREKRSAAAGGNDAGQQERMAA